MAAGPRQRFAAALLGRQGQLPAVGFARTERADPLAYVLGRPRWPCRMRRHLDAPVLRRRQWCGSPVLPARQSSRLALPRPTTVILPHHHGALREGLFVARCYAEKPTPQVSVPRACGYALNSCVNNPSLQGGRRCNCGEFNTRSIAVSTRTHPQLLYHLAHRPRQDNHEHAHHGAGGFVANNSFCSLPDRSLIIRCSPSLTIRNDIAG